MSSDLGQEPSYDTHLARLLHERGRVEVQVLQGYLARAREQRDLDPSLSLALTLVQGGVLSREEADRYLAELRPSGRLTQTHAAPSDAETPATTGWRPGGHVDRYAILDQLGQGGMGTVYLAERDGEQFAIKVLPFETDPDLQARFQREYDAQSAITPHPNVLRVRGAGVGAGAHYLVLDLATGGDLQERLRQGPLPVGEATDLCRQLARGLAHVHAHGILHRDIKPGNVLFDANGTPKLVDFGLARSTRRSESSLTRTGELLGTPSYMAPEQATGVRGEVGVASDLYGLAALLFHTLTGRPPFVGASTLDVLTQVVTSPPPRPSSIRTEVSPGLDAVILKALSKAPEDRHASAAELADALERVGATPLTRRVPLGLVAAAAISLLTTVGAVALRSGPTATPTPLATAARPTDAPIPAAPTESALATPRDPLGVWSPRVGTRMETDVLYNSKRTWLVDGRRTDALAVNGEAGGSLTMHGKVARTGAQIAIDVTVAAWSLREVGFIVQDRIFDSNRPNANKSPLYAAVGKTFRFTMDARTGQVVSVEGLEAIQAAILAPSALDLGAKVKVDLFTESQMFDALNMVWHCLPHPRTDSDGQPLKHWRVTPAAPRQLKVLQGYAKSAFSAHETKAVGPPSAGPLTKLVTITNRRGDKLFASWKASADTRRASAYIVIEDGLVRESKIRHSISFLGERTTKDRTAKIEWRFESTYTARLKIVTRR